MAETDTDVIRDALREKNGGPPFGNFPLIIPFFSMRASLMNTELLKI